MSGDLFNLSGRTAIVTGAGRGLGKAMASALASAGAKVVIGDIDGAAAENSSEDIRSQGGESLSFTCDISKDEDVTQMVAGTVKKFGAIDILVNNAGINIRKPLTELTAEDFNRVNGININGTFLCCRAVFPFMRDRAYGKIINIASLAGIKILRGTDMSPYYVSKTGVVAFTKAAASEWAPHGIRVNAISPGWFITDFNRHLWDDPEIARVRLEQTPLGRVAQPEELAGTVVYLAASGSDYVTGHNIAVDGGYCVY
jgi:NAD(P)-dependent dehydrogenase (short-subunit alcohol dehydrogenase family)